VHFAMGKAQYLTHEELFLRAWRARYVWAEDTISYPETHNLVVIAGAVDAYKWAGMNGKYAPTVMA